MARPGPWDHLITLFPCEVDLDLAGIDVGLVEKLQGLLGVFIILKPNKAELARLHPLAHNLSVGNHEFAVLRKVGFHPFLSIVLGQVLNY